MKKESLYNLYSILAWIGAAIAFIGFILIGFSLTWIVLFIGCLITFTSLLALFISKKQEQTKHLEEQRKALKIQAEKYAHAKTEEETKAAEELTRKKAEEEARAAKDLARKKALEEKKRIEKENFERLVRLIENHQDEILKESEQFYLPIKNFMEQAKKIVLPKQNEPFDSFLFSFVDFSLQKRLFLLAGGFSIKNKLLLHFLTQDNIKIQKDSYTNTLKLIINDRKAYSDDLPTINVIERSDLYCIFKKGFYKRFNTLNKGWITPETTDAIAYLILRANFIRYDAEQYELFFPTDQEKAFDLFYSKNHYLVKKFNDYSRNYKKYSVLSIGETYISYYLYKTNPSPSFSKARNVINSAYDKYFSSRKQKEEAEKNTALENFLFGDSVAIPSTEPQPKPPIEQIDEMTGRQFEEYISKLFQKMGYSTTLTPTSGDYGIDVIAKNDFLTIGIQTKCYKEKVPNSAVQEAVTGLRHYKLDKAMVITNSDFQPSAYELAKDNNVILWNRKKLIEEIEKYEEKPALTQKANSSTPKSTAPANPNDAREKVQIRIGMSVRHAEFGLGTISDLNKNEGYLKVMFGSGTKQFTYPYAFTSNTLKIEE